MRNISIIIPHYQKQEALKRTWEDLQLQIHPDDEIIIVDDHSPDGVPDLNCPCTRVIQPPREDIHIWRLNTVRNYGFQHAKYDWCLILDPDCIPNLWLVNSARNLHDPSILYGGCIDKENEDGEIIPDTRRKGDDSYWVDIKDKGGGGIWGGCMLFSKSRTRLVGWFDEDFNGAWGAGEVEFASKCYHSGMRLRYSTELQVTHQYHPKYREGHERNREIYIRKTNQHRTNLNTYTPYKPRVGVMVITTMRPDLINQCLQAIFRNNIPMKVRLINNGDTGEQTHAICSTWGNRWSVDYDRHSPRWPALVRNASMRWARDNNFKYLVFIDDDMLVTRTGIVHLVRAMERHPEYYAVAGCHQSPGREPKMGGGVVTDGAFWNYKPVTGVKEGDWVGGGFTIHRVDPVLFYDYNYQTGYNDFDWSMMAKQEGHRLAVCGEAKAYHGYKLTKDGLEKYKNPTEYNKLRYDRERHARMRELFKSKWGFEIQKGGVLV